MILIIIKSITYKDYSSYPTNDIIVSEINNNKMINRVIKELKETFPMAIDNKKHVF